MGVCVGGRGQHKHTRELEEPLYHIGKDTFTIMEDNFPLSLLWALYIYFFQCTQARQATL